jgi:hypothetical protein
MWGTSLKELKVLLRGQKLLVKKTETVIFLKIGDLISHFYLEPYLYQRKFKGRSQSTK